MRTHAVATAILSALLAAAPGPVLSQDIECKNHFILRCPVPAAIWRDAVPMTYATGTGAAASVLGDGRVLVTGGEEAPYGAQLFDPATRTWRAAPPMHAPRFHHRSVTLADGRVLVAGGDRIMNWFAHSYPILQATAEIYDPAVDAWSPTGPLTALHAVFARDLTLTLLLDGSVLLTGGSDVGWGGSDATETYDVAANSWRAAGRLERGRVGHTATLLADGSVLVIGGVTDRDMWFPVPSIERYDPRTRRWTAIGDSPKVAGHATSLLADGRLLVTGGQTPTPVIGAPPGATWPYGSTPSASLLELATGQWSAVLPMPSARHDHAAIAVGAQQVVALGGHVASMPVLYSYSDAPVPGIVAFDLPSGTWRAVDELGSAPADPQSTVPLRDGSILVVGVEKAAILTLASGKPAMKPIRASAVR